MSRRPFNLDEITDGDEAARPPDDDNQSADLLLVARTLERTADAASLTPSTALTARIMRAIAGQPTPNLTNTFLLSLGAWDMRAAWRALTASARLATAGGGRAAPLGLRLKAGALVVAVALVVAGGGGAAAVGAVALVTTLSHPTGPIPSNVASPSVPTASPALPAVPAPSARPSPKPSELETPDPSESPDHGGSPGAGGGSGGDGGDGRGGPDPSASLGHDGDDGPEPSASDEGGDGGSGGYGGGGSSPSPDH